MDLLVDTHAIIWFITDDSRLPNASKALIEDKRNTCFASLVSFWEMGIKYSLGRLDFKTDLSEIFSLIEQSGFTILAISQKHVLKIIDLPFHHRDPFDRLLIAQAQYENLTILTKDQWYKSYNVKEIWLK